MHNKVIKVLIVDDSALVREILSRILSQDRDIKIIGTAADPILAVKKIKAQKPDVITLDLEMPRMDGLTFLSKLMSVFPLPVVVVSSLAQSGSAATIRALELGAVDFVTKPSIGLGKGLEGLGREIIAKVKNAAGANMDVLQKNVNGQKKEQSTYASEKKSGNEPAVRPLVNSTDKIIAIGASTGGTVAVKKIISRLPANLPGILIVLHMPPNFTASYAQSLNEYSRIKVKEAAEGEPVAMGSAYVAPGGKHMELGKGAKGYILKIDEGPALNHHRPSVDKVFYSIARYASPNSMGIVLTGMGDDGARGLKEMHSKGSYTVVQDKESCVVFGMPRQAILHRGVDRVLDLEEIANEIVNFVKGEHEVSRHTRI